MGNAETRTLREWEQEYGIFILDLDGFDQTDPQLYKREFSRSEFEQGIAECTVIVNKHSLASKNSASMRFAAQPIEKSQSPVNTFNQSAPTLDTSTPVTRKAPFTTDAMHHLVDLVKAKRNKVSSARKQRLSTRQKSTIKPEPIHVSRILWFGATLPTLATFFLDKLCLLLVNRFQIRWYWPMALLAMDAFVIFMQPVAPLIAGPLYVWYLLFGWLAALFGGIFSFIDGSIFHHSTLSTGGLHTPQNAPFLSSVTLFGNPASLYFSFQAALASSLVWAIAIVCIRCMKIDLKFNH